MKNIRFFRGCCSTLSTPTFHGYECKYGAKQTRLD
jgi:hypothetical protein